MPLGHVPITQYVNRSERLDAQTECALKRWTQLPVTQFGERNIQLAASFGPRDRVRIIEQQLGQFEPDQRDFGPDWSWVQAAKLC